MGPTHPIHQVRASKKNTVKSTSATRALPLLIALITAGLISAPTPEAKAQTSKARNAAAKEKERTLSIQGRYFVEVAFGDFPFAMRFTPVR